MCDRRKNEEVYFAKKITAVSGKIMVSVFRISSNNDLLFPKRPAPPLEIILVIMRVF
jgi:hypothetical protein